MSTSSNESVVIKKYANRRLYNTATSTYVTLSNLAEMVKNGVEFNVYDAKNNEDITRGVLAQIIVEEEGKTGQNLLPISFLRRLIGFYGDSMQWLVPKYLEHSLQSLTKNQEQIRDYFQKTFGGMFPFNNTFEQMSKQNMAMFENTMQMFSPFGIMGLKDVSAPVMSAACSTALVEKKIEPVSVVKKTVEVPVEKVSACSIEGSGKKKQNDMPTPETDKVAQQKATSSADVQDKIAALQRQLAELAKSKAS